MRPGSEVVYLFLAGRRVQSLVLCDAPQPELVVIRSELGQNGAKPCLVGCKGIINHAVGVLSRLLFAGR